MTERFKTLFRGHEVDVEMTLLSMHPPALCVVFNGSQEHLDLDPPLTRQELIALVREAQRNAEKRRQC